MKDHSEIQSNALSHLTVPDQAFVAAIPKSRTLELYCFYIIKNYVQEILFNMLI